MIKSELDDGRSDVPTSIAGGPGFENQSIPCFHPLQWGQKCPKLWNSSHFEQPQSKDQPEPRASFASRVQLQPFHQGRAKWGPILTVKTTLRSLETSTEEKFLMDKFNGDDFFSDGAKGVTQLRGDLSASSGVWRIITVPTFQSRLASTLITYETAT
jgi:hypothetical protein